MLTTDTNSPQLLHARKALTIACALLLCRGELPAQTVERTPMDYVVTALVFTARMPEDLTPFSASLASLIADYRARADAYQTKVRPLPSSDFAMVYRAWESYERRLVAISTHPQAAVHAQSYVEQLRPCYEWEGFHNCPEADALFAERYLATNPTGPFAEYLRLLAGHRWLCAAEGYDYEQRAPEAARSRAASAPHLRAARASANELIRSAAERLTQRAKCI